MGFLMFATPRHPPTMPLLPELWVCPLLFDIIVVITVIDITLAITSSGFFYVRHAALPADHATIAWAEGVSATSDIIVAITVINITHAIPAAASAPLSTATSAATASVIHVSSPADFAAVSAATSAGDFCRCRMLSAPVPPHT